MIVLKNNQASAVIISPEENGRLSEIEENYYLLTEAQQRLAAHQREPGLSRSEVMEHFGISEADISAAAEPVIE